MTPNTVNLAAITALKSEIKENAIELGMPKDHPMLVKLDDRKPSYLRRLTRRLPLHRAFITFINEQAAERA